MSRRSLLVHTLADAAKLVPKGVICLTLALAFHGLTVQDNYRGFVKRSTKPKLP